MKIIRNILLKKLPTYATDIFLVSYAVIYKLITLNLITKPKKIDGDLKTVAILGNGPSLENDIESIIENKTNFNIYVVNYFANTKYFCNLKPSTYVLADPIFWREKIGSKYIKDNSKLINNLLKVNWNMTLVCRDEGYSLIKKQLLPNKNINVVKLPSYWFDIRTEKANIFALKFGISSPNFVNVLIAAIWHALLIGSKNIELYGADYSGFKNFQVDQTTNKVYSSSTHFYKESNDSREMIADKYEGEKPKMINIRFYQLWLGFRQMHLLSIVSKLWGCKIINKSSFSYLDCFDRF